MAEGAVTFGVPDGEQFVPRLFAELGQPIRVGERRAPVAGRRVHVLHGHHDPRRRGLQQTDHMRNVARMMSR